LPNADDAHLQLKTTTSSKEARRLNVLKTHNILLLCGDNLPDFDMLYDNHPTEESRAATTQKLEKEFGSMFIISLIHHMAILKALFNGLIISLPTRKKIRLSGLN
jgi:predicted secreted acid phosphatase